MSQLEESISGLQELLLIGKQAKHILEERGQYKEVDDKIYADANKSRNWDWHCNWDK